MLQVATHIAAIALTAGIYRWRHRPPGKPTALAKPWSNRAFRPVALRLEGVSVGAAWGARVTLAEALGVLAFILACFLIIPGM
jgi:hypothetical protein